MNELEVKKMNMARKMLNIQKINENQKYGELIVQANEIQTKLALAIMDNSVSPDQKYYEKIFNMTGGSLITLAQTCIRLSEENLTKLRKYNEDRNRLAHKMFVKEKMTISDCTKILAEGKKIISLLDKIIYKK